MTPSHDIEIDDSSDLPIYGGPITENDEDDDRALDYIYSQRNPIS